MRPFANFSSSCRRSGQNTFEEGWVHVSFAEPPKPWMKMMSITSESGEAALDSWRVFRPRIGGVVKAGVFPVEPRLGCERRDSCFGFFLKIFWSISTVSNVKIPSYKFGDVGNAAIGMNEQAQVKSRPKEPKSGQSGGGNASCHALQYSSQTPIGGGSTNLISFVIGIPPRQCHHSRPPSFTIYNLPGAGWLGMKLPFVWAVSRNQLVSETQLKRSLYLIFRCFGP